ncbi:hypothetical protein AXG93_4182s1430 [Marchantia polymorpha subsp. ruderalis]|uniref:Uncharacterized protein n=1 Tax=Marchantia polymorpha subsp. ruderalis TaxID=1480154 RepID=A0A176VGZ7_MARPO|nr:hypothetical protein AXG93_4182s1430 [Marchantia polymorpha subsp. ruderalis]
MGSMSALLGGGIVCWAYGAYVINNHYKEKEAKTNDPEQIFTANDKQDDARVRKIKKRLILGSLVYGVYDMFEGKPPIEWWTKVHYDLLELDEVLTEDDLDRYATELQDEHKNKYLGVFRRKKESPSAEASDWVVAISGTEPLNWADLQNDLAIILETLNSKNLITILEAIMRTSHEAPIKSQFLKP